LKNITNYFSPEALAELEKQMGIKLDSAYDYSGDELDDLYEQITDEFPYEYAEDGNPRRLGRIFEEIVDVFSGLKE
jgi:hypothetical protein